MVAGNKSNARTALLLLVFVVILVLNLLIISDMNPHDSALNKSSRKPLIALLIPASSDVYPAPWNTTTLPIYTKMFPSLINNLDCGYRYMAVVGYKRDDSYFDTMKGLDELNSWFETAVRMPMEKRNFDIKLVTVRVDKLTSGEEMWLHRAYNMCMYWATTLIDKVRLILGLDRLICIETGSVHLGVVNTIAKKAYALGADFLFRIDDDTFFSGRFTKPFVAVILSSETPYGVAGPSSLRKRDSNYIMRHHFVHRTHMDMFSMHFYPHDLEESWVNQWISRVYGPQRTFIAKNIATMSRPLLRTNFNIPNSAGYISEWIRIGRERIHHWIDDKYHNNVTAVRSKKAVYSGVGRNIMTALNFKPDFLNLNLECSGVDRKLSSRFERCLKIKNEHTLKYLGDFEARASRISLVERTNWKLYNCSRLVIDPSLKRIHRSVIRSESSKNPRPLKLNLRPPLVNCSTDAAHLPLIAIMAATTSRNVKSPSDLTCSLTKIMLPSLIYSLDCGYRYAVVIGYDLTDKFYNSTDGSTLIRSWFENNIASVMQKYGVNIFLEYVGVDNKILKPGPVFLKIARHAYDIGADYMYRVNDDTEFIERWPKVFVEALQSLSPPFGVVGPRSYNTDNRILTHDFVHRTHMNVFKGYYYPVELEDWWMDDWISSVYGSQRSYMAKEVTIYHHIKAHGKRYMVDFDNERRLTPLVTEGRRHIADWMMKENVPYRHRNEFLFNTANESTSQDIKLRYFSTGSVVEDYYEIKCYRGRNVTFCPPPGNKKQTFRVPDTLSSLPRSTSPNNFKV